MNSRNREGIINAFCVLKGKIHYSEYQRDVISYRTAMPDEKRRKKKKHKRTSEGQMRDGKRKE